MMKEYEIEICDEIRIDHRGDTATNDGTEVLFSCYIDSNIYIDELYLRFINDDPSIWTECAKCYKSHVCFPSKELRSQIVLEVLKKMNTYHFCCPLNNMEILIFNAKTSRDKTSRTGPVV